MRSSGTTGAIDLVVALVASPVRAGDFGDCGLLIQEVECVLFQADSGGLYVLDNYGGLGVGDRVRVTGTLDPGCITSCQQGNGCIHDNTIGSCDGEIPTVSQWGLIGMALVLLTAGATVLARRRVSAAA